MGRNGGRGREKREKERGGGEGVLGELVSALEFNELSLSQLCHRVPPLGGNIKY